MRHTYAAIVGQPRDNHHEETLHQGIPHIAKFLSSCHCDVSKHELYLVYHHYHMATITLLQLGRINVVNF